MDIAQELAVIADLLDHDNEPQYNPQDSRVIREAVRLLVEAECFMQRYADRAGPNAERRSHEWCRQLRSSLMERVG